jgi:hypothetical protein
MRNDASDQESTPETVLGLLRVNSLVAAVLPLLWMIADAVYVASGKTYVSSASELPILIGVPALSFFVATGLRVRAVRSRFRVLWFLALVIPWTLLFLVGGTFIMFYFHVLIGGTL